MVGWISAAIFKGVLVTNELLVMIYPLKILEITLIIKISK